jgi:23S rRNA G2445 N2-methylase RlmL
LFIIRWLKPTAMNLIKTGKKSRQIHCRPIYGTDKTKRLKALAKPNLRHSHLKCIIEFQTLNNLNGGVLRILMMIYILPHRYFFILFFSL